RLAEKRGMITSRPMASSRRAQRIQRLLVKIDAAEIAALERQPQSFVRFRRKCGNARVDFRADIKPIDLECRHHGTRGLAAADGDAGYAIGNEADRELAKEMLDGGCDRFPADMRLRGSDTCGIGGRIDDWSLGKM